MVVFRPFKGEAIAARIADQSSEGINRQLPPPPAQLFCLLSPVILTAWPAVATEFFDDIFIPWTELPEGSEL